MTTERYVIINEGSLKKNTNGPPTTPRPPPPKAQVAVRAAADAHDYGAVGDNTDHRSRWLASMVNAFSIQPDNATAMEFLNFAYEAAMAEGKIVALQEVKSAFRLAPELPPHA